MFEIFWMKPSNLKIIVNENTNIENFNDKLLNIKLAIRCLWKIVRNMPRHELLIYNNFQTKNPMTWSTTNLEIHFRLESRSNWGIKFTRIVPLFDKFNDINRYENMEVCTLAPTLDPQMATYSCLFLLRTKIEAYTLSYFLPFQSQENGGI